MTSSHSYWETTFLAGSCYRDYYCGKEHLLVKAHSFIVEGLKRNDLCVYFGLWQQDIISNLKHCNYLVDDLIKEGHLLFLNKCFNFPGNLFLLESIHQKVIKNNLNVGRVFRQIEHYDERFYTDRFLIETALQIEGMIRDKKLFMLCLCNFDTLISE